MSYFPEIPPASTKRIALRVNSAAEKNIRRGHPWLFDGSITDQSHPGRSGDLAVIFDRKRRFMAIGLYDPDSPIRVKILHAGSPAPIDADWFRAQLRAAAERRAGLPESGTSGYRLVFGEGDGLPGLIIDRFEDTLVLKIYTAAWFPHLNDILAGLDEVQPAERWVLRLSRALAQQSESNYGLVDGQILKGGLPEKPLIFQENRLLFAVDVVHGHKTGFFCDHRDNRQKVRQLSGGRKVLDIFAYSGGFSLYAAAGGATSVTSLDISRPALEMAQVNFDLNRSIPQVSQAAHELIVGEAFAQLTEMAEQGRKFDMVIVDPPSFAKSAAEIDRALIAYEKLTRSALDVLDTSGLLVMASCSSRVRPDRFFEIVYDTAEAVGRPLWTHARTGHAIDHPLRPSFPEGEYLKCLFASVID